MVQLNEELQRQPRITLQNHTDRQLIIRSSDGREEWIVPPRIPNGPDGEDDPVPSRFYDFPCVQIGDRWYPDGSIIFPNGITFHFDPYDPDIRDARYAVAEYRVTREWWDAGYLLMDVIVDEDNLVW